MDEKMFEALRLKFKGPEWYVESVTNVTGRGKGVYNVWFVTRDGRRSMDRMRVWWEADGQLATCSA